MSGRISEGSPEPLGVVPAGDGVNAAVFSAHAEAVDLCLFDADGVETQRIRLAHRTGDVFHAQVAGIGAGQRYGLRVHGPCDPGRGHRFNAAKLLVDPYATRLERPFALDPTLFGCAEGQGGTPDPRDSAAHVPKGVVEAAVAPPEPNRPRVPWGRTVIYELSVKGFTARHRQVPPDLRGTFAGLASPAAIEHLLRLGVTTVEIMPAAAWIDERHLPPLGLANAWGYNPIAMLAPDPRLAPGGWSEVRAAVDALHAAGLEVILDVVLNHTGEGDERGPTVSLRGLDNAGYYRLRPDDPSRYVDDTGCGNTLALDRPAVMRLALDALRLWVRRAGLDGFRFDLATTLGRRADGFDPAAPLLSAIAQDPELRDLKLIAEPWEPGPGGYRAGAFPAEWGEWNDRFRDDVRRFWRGDAGMLGAMATRIAGSSDLFGGKRRSSRSVNFVVAHDGFTLADLVAYESKHNAANGEANRDGTDANHSWNHGVEGPSDDPLVAAARRRDQRALLATLLLARGTPMLAMGAEAGRSQAGNNNAYAQDNPLSWFDWERADAALARFTARVIALRRDNPALRDDRFLTGAVLPGLGAPDVEWRTPAGSLMADGDWARGGRTLVAVLGAAGKDPWGSRVVLVLNAASDRVEVVLPEARPGHAWSLALDTAIEDAAAGGTAEADGPEVVVPARAVALFVERRAARHGRQGVPDVLLDRLAGEAGIAPDWWDETGRHHLVGADTKRALLAAMRLPATTLAEAEDSLARIAHAGALRCLPGAIAARVGEAIRVRLAVEGQHILPAPVFGVERKGGGVETVTAQPDWASQADFTAPDGRSGCTITVALPPLPMGRHLLRFADRPDVACRLTVAPARCWLPPELAGGRRRFGLAAHLYTLRRPGDCGIGDFTALAELGTGASAAGAITVGLNPLHALFPADRERASPYHPSDRRFLDPIYLDVAALGEADPANAACGVLVAHGAAAEALRHLRQVDYPRVWALKRAALEAAFAGFQAAGLGRPDHPAARTFAAFQAGEGDDLARFARFEALCELNPGSWPNWPAGLHDADAPATLAAAPRERVAFHAWLQWLCRRQLDAAAAQAAGAGLSLGFYRDLAVGAAPDGAEVWAGGAEFARGVSIGAPPDRFSAEGQVWNLPPPDPLVQAATGGAALARVLAANMRAAGALRIDHVMGLERLFWVPDGARGADGAYVAHPFAHLMAQLALESNRGRVAIVGEDLGTVPAGFRERLAAADVLSYRVLWFERSGEAFLPPSAYPALAAACVSTHDLPTLRGWFEAADIAEKRSLGLLDEAAATVAREARRREKRLLFEALTAAGLLPAGFEPDQALGPGLVEAIHAFIAQSPAVLALAQLDDLAGEAAAVNLPGTDRERPNWRRRLSLPVADLMRSEPARSVLAVLRRLRA